MIEIERAREDVETIIDLEPCWSGDITQVEWEHLVVNYAENSFVLNDEEDTCVDVLLGMVGTQVTLRIQTNINKLNEAVRLQVDHFLRLIFYHVDKTNFVVRSEFRLVRQNWVLHVYILTLGRGPLWQLELLTVFTRTIDERELNLFGQGVSEEKLTRELVLFNLNHITLKLCLDVQRH